MNLLHVSIRYEEMIAYGAAELYPECYLRHWFGRRDSLTVEEALTSQAGINRILFLIMRDAIVPSPIMHRIAVGACRLFLDRLEKDDVYLDFRLRGLLETKERWIEGAAGYAELRAAQESAQRVQNTVFTHPDPRARQAAYTVACALQNDGALAVKQVFYCGERVYNDAQYTDAFHEQIRFHLSQTTT